MQPLDIALLTYSTKPRGSVVHTLELAEALHSRGHQVCIYALDKDGQGLGRSLACQVRLIPTQPAAANIDQLICQRIQEFVDFLVWQFRLGDRPHQVYHAQDCLSANAVVQFREKVGRRNVPSIVRTVHHIESYTSPYLKDCQDRSIQQSDLCLCVSRHWQQQVQAHYGIQALRVINGINRRRFLPANPGAAIQADIQAAIQADIQAADQPPDPADAMHVPTRTQTEAIAPSSPSAQPQS